MWKLLRWPSHRSLGHKIASDLFRGRMELCWPLVRLPFCFGRFLKSNRVIQILAAFRQQEAGLVELKDFVFHGIGLFVLVNLAIITGLLKV